MNLPTTKALYHVIPFKLIVSAKTKEAPPSKTNDTLPVVKH